MSLWGRSVNPLILKLIVFLHCTFAVAIVVCVLIQHGKGADLGASFGAGMSNSLFGVSGSSVFLSRLTAAFAVCFFITSIGLTYLQKFDGRDGHSVIKDSKSVLVKNGTVGRSVVVEKKGESTVPK